MTNRALLCILATVLAPALAVSAPSTTPPASTDSKAGHISALLPVAHIVRGAGQQASSNEASKGTELVWDDLVKTERGGRARITLVDQSILSLGSQAELKIVRRDGRSQQPTLQLGYGRLRAQVSKIVREGEELEVQTATAVAGAIGTDFAVDASTVGTTRFVCMSGLVLVSNIDLNVSGTVECAAGMTTSVKAGEPPTTPVQATPEEIQEVIQETEPAAITAISPSSVLAGSSVDAVVTGSKLSGVVAADISGEGVAASLAGSPTDASATVHLEVSVDAAPGPRTITLTKENEAVSAAIFSIVSPPAAAAPGESPKDPYAEVFEQQRLSEGAGLSAYLAEVRQARDQALQLWQQANRAGIDVSQGISELNAQIAAVEEAIESAETRTNEAVAEAREGFDTEYESAEEALQERSPDGTPDDSFNEDLQNTFQEVNTALAADLNKIQGDLAGVVQTASDNITQLQQKWLATLTGPQPPTPSVDNIERSIDVGAGFGSGNVAALDASSSRGIGGASIVRYEWVLCDPSYKPAQFGVPIAATAAGCNVLPGFASSSSDFRFGTCNLDPGDYIARVTVYDSNGQASAMDVKVHVQAPTYDDPATVLRNLASAYTSLQMQQFLAFFDEANFPGYDAMAENIRNTFPALGTMNINILISQASASCSTSPAGEATVRADWELNYTFKQVCQPIANTDPVQQACSDPSVVYHDKEQLSVRMTRTPGKGWLIVDFQGDNGTVQGKVPGPLVTDASQPDMRITAVYPGYASQGSTAALPVAAGTQSFTGTISNVGTAVVTTETSVRFQLLDGAGAPLGNYVDVPLAVPLNAGTSETVSAELPVAGSLGTGFQVSATVNPTCTTAETNCANNSLAQPLVIGAVNFQVALAQAFSPAQNVLVGGLAEIPIALTETGSTYALPITVGPANGNLTYTIPSSPMAPGTQTITVTSSSSVATGSFPLTIAANSYGLTQSVTQPLNFVSAKLVPTNLFLNDPSNPLEIQMGQTSLTMLPNLQLTLASTFFSGSATVSAPPPALGFNSTVDNGATTTVGAGGTFTWQITANYGASTTVVPLTVSAQLPNSNPPAVVPYTLYVKATGVPDLQIVSATPARSISSAEPWIDGEALDFSVVVQNSGPVASAGGEQVTCRLRGYDVGSTRAPSLAPGERAPLNLHCVAPDIDGDNATSTTVAFNVRIEPDRSGDLNYANNKTADVYYPWSNWHARVTSPVSPSGSGSGTESDPLRISVMYGYATPFWVTIDGYLDSGRVSPSATFGIAPGVVNENFIYPQFGGGTSTGNIRFDQVRATASMPAQSGIYILQALVQLRDGTTVTAQRQATIYVLISSFLPTPAEFLTLTSSAHNCFNPSPDGGCANGPTPNTVQINGKLVEQLGLSVMRSGCASTPCEGSVDLSFTDAANTATSPPLQITFGFGELQTIQVGALLDPDGVINSPGPAANYTVSATAVQVPSTPPAYRAQVPSPSPAGITFQLAFNVGDINITPYSAACVGVAAGGSATLSFGWQPVSGFNAPLQWEWEDGSYAPVGAAPLSFTPGSGSDSSTTGAYGALPTFTLRNTQALDGLQTYFFAVKVSNQFSSATKWFPFYFDLSTSQNFCGALLNSARGFAGARGTWSRAAAGGGGVTTSAVRSRTTSTTAGQPDLRLSASDVSFMPSLPKIGDTVQVRFRVRNEGTADGRGVPIALQVNGISVAMDTFDVPAGSTALGGLEWKSASVPSGTRADSSTNRAHRPLRFKEADAPEVERGLPTQMLRVQLVIDPQHTIQQKTTLGKTAVLTRFSLRQDGASPGLSTASAGSQRVLLELQEGSCVGLRLRTSSAGPCGTADVEITVGDADKGGITLSSLSGVADVGAGLAASVTRIDNARLAASSYSTQAAGAAGHSYAVKLSNGQAGLLTIVSLRNPGQLSVAARKVFRANAARILRRIGGTTGPADPDDVAGGRGSKESLFLELLLQLP